MILPKEEIKYIFNPYILLPGDILLMNTYEERLRNKLGCQYEHVALYIKGQRNRYIDSIAKKHYATASTNDISD